MAWIPEGYSGWLFGGFSVSTVLWGFLMVYSFNTALHYRPLPDHTGIGRARTSTRLRELRTDMVPVGLHVARWMVQVATVAFSKYMIGWRNKIEVVDDANSKFLYSAMRTRPQGVPLLTVANHASSMDDPGLLSCMMPLDVILRPSKVRWSIATQEIVFPDIPWIQAFMGAGNVLPIWRGGGIDQPLFHDFARQIAGGSWGHVFPEARVVQSGLLGIDAITKRSAPEQREKGVLKWGIGKLVAHMPVKPVVVPFWHYGMAAVLQQHNKWEGDVFNNRVISWRNMAAGNTVKVWIGEEIHFDDLISQHEKKHGPLHKIDTQPNGHGEAWDVEFAKWKTRETDKALYSAITARVEKSLRTLQERADAAVASAPPDDKLHIYCPRSRLAMAHPRSSRAPPKEATLLRRVPPQEKKALEDKPA